MLEICIPTIKKGKKEKRKEVIVWELKYSILKSEPIIFFKFSILCLKQDGRQTSQDPKRLR
jgi:hypothetical protein